MENTRPSSRWFDTYTQDTVGVDSPEMLRAIDEYASHRHERTSGEAEEELARQREINYGIAQEYRFLDYNEYKDIEPRIGQVFTYEQFITRLRDVCKLKCFYREMGHPQMLSLWALKKGSNEPQLVTWVQRPAMAEFEVPKFDERHIPSGFRYRGWRSVLMEARRKEFLPERLIVKAFGEATGPASHRYNKFFQSLRQHYE